MQRNNAGSRSSELQSQLIKGGIAAVVILASIAYLTWLFWPTPPVVLPAPQDPVALWQKSFGTLNREHAEKKDAIYWLFANIITQPNADNTGISVTGKVRTQGELASVKAEFAKVEPAVPIEWNVRVGG